MQCPFVRGESTDNVPITLTDASHPAIQVLEDQSRDQVVCLGTSHGSHLGGVATEQGRVFLLDLVGKLTISVSSEMAGMAVLVGWCSRVGVGNVQSFASILFVLNSNN